MKKLFIIALLLMSFALFGYTASVDVNGEISKNINPQDTETSITNAANSVFETDGLEISFYWDNGSTSNTFRLYITIDGEPKIKDMDQFENMVKTYFNNLFIEVHGDINFSTSWTKPLE